MNFAHLHVHTEFSLLDGSSKIKEITARAKELGMNSLAITDHGVMYGAIDFYRAANANRKTQSLDTGFGNRLLWILARKRFGSRLYRRQSRRFRFFGDHHHPMGTFNTAGGAFGTPPVHHPDSARVGIGWRYACQAAPGVSAWAWRAGGDRKAAVRLDSS